MTKSQLKQLRPANFTKLELNAPLSLPMKRELKNSIWSRCGNHLMEQSETIWEEQFSENLFSLKIFQDMFQVGLIQLSLADMLLEINTEPLISLPQKLESLRWYSPLQTDPIKLLWKYLISQELELWWVCTIQMSRLLNSLIHVSSMLSKETTRFIWAQKTQFLKSMMEDLKIFLKKFIRKIINRSLILESFGMSTGLLTIWSHIASSQKEDSYGHAKTMMEMSNQMLLLRDMDLLDWWLQSLLLLMEL